MEGEGGRKKESRRGREGKRGREREDGRGRGRHGGMEAGDTANTSALLCVSIHSLFRLFTLLQMPTQSLEWILIIAVIASNKGFTALT